jgi:ubiquinone biosynthesis UbiH/UbiF/VisC/COQ6 family hydroxylase
MEIHGDAGGRLDLDAWQAGASQLAWIVESTEIERVLEQAVSWSGVAWVDDIVAAWQPGSLTTATGRVLATALAIGADGAASPLRKMAGLIHHSKPYGDVGLVAHFDTQWSAQHTALQWFCDDGVLALLPLPDSARGPQVSMVWSVHAGRAQDMQSLLPEVQAERLPSMLAAITGGRLGALRLNSRLFGLPLYVEHVDPIATGVALIGDAAHRVHPLAGQGLNLGLGDVEALVAAVVGREPFRAAGDMRVLRRYRRARAEPVAAMRLVTDGLHRLFTTQGGPVARLRNAGLSWVDAVPALKRVLVEQASHS